MSSGGPKEGRLNSEVVDLVEWVLGYTQTHTCTDMCMCTRNCVFEEVHVADVN